MSNEVYPKLPGQALPVGRIVIPPPVQVRTTPSQREYRARDASLPRYQYSLPYNWLHADDVRAQLQTLVGFYNRHGGPFDSWLFDDVDDNTATAALFGIGNGSTVAFPLLRSFGGFAESVDAVQAVPAVFGLGSHRGVGNFEVDSNSDGLANGWFVFTSATGRTHSTQLLGSPSNGTYVQYLEITAAGTGVADSGIFSSQRMSVSPGVSYTAGADFRTNTVGASMVVRVFNLDSSTYNDFQLISPAVASYTTPRLVQFQFTAPSWAASAEIQFRGIASAGQYLCIDAVQVVPTQYFAAPSSGQLALLPGIDYTVDSGTLTLASGSIAPVGVSLAWSGQFYRRCRFLGDRLDTQRFMRRMYEARRVEFISCRG